MQKNENVEKIQETVQKSTNQAKSDRELQIEKDTRIVRGRFKFDEIRGGVMKFPFRKYKEIPIKHYALRDGEIYELPYMVARHLNDNCWYPIHNYLQDEDGKVSTKIGQRVSRCSFIPLDFTDIDTNNADKKIITVQRV